MEYSEEETQKPTKMAAVVENGGENFRRLKKSGYKNEDDDDE